MQKTKIEWTDYTWNPVTGCTKVSPGCRSCYAERLAKRFTRTMGDFAHITEHPERVSEPLGKKALRGKRVFVCDVSDLFHEKVSFEFIDSVFMVMQACPETTFQILTKRPHRMLEWFNSIPARGGTLESWPLKNVWFGVSVESQRHADDRICLLLEMPVAVRYISYEPALGPVDIYQSVRLFSFKKFGNINSTYFGDLIHWVIAGGETGPMARPAHPEWFRSIREQCRVAGVAFFFKQWGDWAVGSASKSNKRSTHIFLDGFRDAFQVVRKGETAVTMLRVGKKDSGNTLDGASHSNYPVCQH